MVNAFWEPLNFELPEADAATTRWQLWIDTAQPSPADLHDWATAPAVTTSHQRVEARSLVAVFALIAAG
jgi:isoamylase